MHSFICPPTEPPIHSSIYPPTHPPIHPVIHAFILSFILQQAADAQEGPAAHHEAKGSISSQQALPSSQASKPSTAYHVDAPSAQPEAEHDQQSALTADSEGSTAPDRQPVSTEESCISEDVEVLLTPSPASEGYRAPPIISKAKDGLTETSKVAVTPSSPSSRSAAASAEEEEEEPTGAVVTADSGQAGAGPGSSVKASNSPLGLQAINSFSMPAKSGQPGAVSSRPIEGPNSPQGMQYSDTPATSQVAHLEAEGISEAPTATGSTPTAAALHPTAGAKITSSAVMELTTDEVVAGTDKAAAEATMGLPPALGHASQKTPTATASLEVKDVAAAEATTGVPPAVTGASQDVRSATTETTAGQRSGSRGLQAVNSFRMPAKSGQPGAVSSSPVEGLNSPQGMQDSNSPATSQVAHLKAEGIAQAPTATGSTPTAAALPTTAGPNNTSTADLELNTDEVAAGTDKAAAETTTNLPPAIGRASQIALAATASLEVKDVAAAETTTDVPPATASASKDLRPSATNTPAVPPSESAVATANLLPDPASAGKHSYAPDARAAPNSPVIPPESAVAVSTAEGSAGCSEDRAAADDLGMGAEAESVPAAPAAKPKSKSKTKLESKARAALEDPAADAEGDMIAAKHPAGQAGTSGNASTKPKTKKRSAKTKVSTQSESASTATLDSPDATAAGSAVRESAHATAAVEAAAVSGCADSKFEVVPGDQRLERLKDPKARKLSSGATAVVYR